MNRKSAALLAVAMIGLISPIIEAQLNQSYDIIRLATGQETLGRVLRLTDTAVVYIQINRVTSQLNDGKVYALPLERVERIVYSDTRRGVFIPGSAENNVVANTESMRFHSANCNHLPSAATRREFESSEKAIENGYIPCPACFYDGINLSEYAIERLLGNEVSAQVRYYYPVSSNDSLNALLETAGSKVLTNWVEPTRGYKYEFKALDWVEPLAIACPAGRIYVSTGMLDMIESEEELSGLIAHEIAHVENRHGFRKFQNAVGGSVFASLVSLMVGVAVADQTDDIDKGVIAGGLTKASLEIAKNIVLTGYDREQQEEADMLAAQYEIDQQGNCLGLLSVLKKLQFGQSIGAITVGDPDLKLRIDSLEQIAKKISAKKEP